MEKDFERALIQFQHEIEKKYGVRDAVIKIALSHEAMNAVIYDLAARDKYSFRMCDMGEFKICGVQILARSRDTF